MNNGLFITQKLFKKKELPILNSSWFEESDYEKTLSNSPKAMRIHEKMRLQRQSSMPITVDLTVVK